jgi:hypothetical protein
VTTNTKPSHVRHGAVLTAALLALFFGLSTAKANERRETLQAIHWVENPRDTPRPGPRGELGAYQFRESTWRMHTPAPFSHARDRTVADEVAVRHYEWIGRGLQRAGLPVTSYNVALAWNCGLSATVRGRVPARAHHYAGRVNNLATQLAKERLAQNGP